MRYSEQLAHDFLRFSEQYFRYVCIFCILLILNTFYSSLIKKLKLLSLSPSGCENSINRWAARVLTSHLSNLHFPNQEPHMHILITDTFFGIYN